MEELKSTTHKSAAPLSIASLPSQVEIVAGSPFVDKEELISEMKSAIDEDSEVQEALQHYQSVVRKRKDMEQALVDHSAKKIKLIEEKRRLSELYGDDPEADFKKLDDVMRGLHIIGEAQSLLSSRLQPDGEMERAEEDAKYTVQNAIEKTLSPIAKKYQALVDRQFDAFIGFLENYRVAVLTAWPMKTNDGTHLRQDMIAKHRQKLTVHDAESRLAFFSDDHAALTRQTINKMTSAKGDEG